MAKRKILWHRIIFLLIIIAVVGYFLVHVLFFRSTETYPADYGELERSDTVESVLFRHEIVVTSEIAGDIKYLVEEGERVDYHQKIIELTKQADQTSEDVAALPPLEREEISQEMVKQQLEQLMQTLLVDIEQEQYREIARLKKEYLDTLSYYDKLGDGFGVSENPEIVAGVLAESNDTRWLLSPVSGIVSYEMDGYEHVKSLYHIDYQSLFDDSVGIKSLEHSYASVGEPLLKIVDYSSYYLIAKVNNEQLGNYKVGAHVQVVYHEKSVQGEVMDVFVQQQLPLVAIVLNEPIDSFYKNRAISCRLVSEQMKGLLVDAGSIIERDGVVGVYIVNQSDMVEFVPIKIISSNEQQSMIQYQQFYNKSLGIVRTVVYGDQIIKNPQLYQPGDFVK